jgi:hypothetical protein
MTRARPWLPQHDDAAREFVARYAPGRDAGFRDTLRDACEAMPRTARVLAIAAGVALVWPVVLMIGRM